MVNNTNVRKFIKDWTPHTGSEVNLIVKNWKNPVFPKEKPKTLELNGVLGFVGFSPISKANGSEYLTITINRTAIRLDTLDGVKLTLKEK